MRPPPLPVDELTRSIPLSTTQNNSIPWSLFLSLVIMEIYSIISPLGHMLAGCLSRASSAIYTYSSSLWRNTTRCIPQHAARLPNRAFARPGKQPSNHARALTTASPVSTISSPSSTASPTSIASPTPSIAPPTRVTASTTDRGFISSNLTHNSTPSLIVFCLFMLAVMLSSLARLSIGLILPNHGFARVGTRIATPPSRLFPIRDPNPAAEGHTLQTQAANPRTT